MFTPKTLSFLRSLKRNNRREWFHARKDQFEAHCRRPMIELVERLAVDMRAFAPELVADPRVSRNWRNSDTLVGPDHVWIGGGAYRPDTSQLQLLREHILANHRRLDAIVVSPAFKKLGGLQGDRLTRVPRGFDKAHKAAPYLMHKQFMAFCEEPGAFATSKDFYKHLLGTLKTLAPLVRFLNEPLIAGQSTARKAHILDE